jgi:hypothetical protein
LKVARLDNYHALVRNSAIALLGVVLAVRGWAAVKLVELPAVRIWASTDKATVVMRLASDSGDSVALSAGDVVLTSNRAVLPAKVTFDPAEAKLAANQITTVKVNVERMFAEGSATAEIRNQGVRLGELLIERFGPGLVLERSWLVFRPGRATALRVKNSTQVPYTVGWMVEIGAVKACGQAVERSCEAVENWKTLTIPPRTAPTIEIEPPPAWFQRWRDETTAARLTLAFSGSPVELPRVELPFEARLSGGIPPRFRRALNMLWLLLLLIIGGVLSLLVRHWVPNIRRKRDLKDHIQKVREKIRGISGEIESVLRVMVRVGILALEARRKSKRTFLPDYETVAAACEARLAKLERQVDLIEQIDSIHDWISGQWERYPATSRIDGIYALLQQASELLRKLEPQEADLEDAQKLIVKAKGLVAAMTGDDQDFGQALLERLGLMKEEWRELGDTDEGKEMKQVLPGPFSILNDHVPAEIKPSQYHWYDANLVALAMLRDYVRLLRRSTNEDFKKRVLEKGAMFLADAAYLSWDKLLAARRMLRQMQENVYVEDIEAAIQKGELTLSQDPPQVSTKRPVIFSVNFSKPEMNWSAALEQVQCEWDFGPDQLKERGCVVAHYFEEEGHKYTVKVKFVKPNGEEVPVPADKVPPLEITPKKDVTDDRTRSVHELVGMGISLVIPLASLIAGAEGELEKGSWMGILGVILLGYSADSIKSVFTQRMQDSLKDH